MGTWSPDSVSGVAHCYGHLGLELYIFFTAPLCTPLCNVKCYILGLFPHVNAFRPVYVSNSCTFQKMFQQRPLWSHFSVVSQNSVKHRNRICRIILRPMRKCWCIEPIGCLPSLSWRHCVKPANSAPEGKASLVIGSRKNLAKLERNVLLFSRPFCRANSNRWQNGWGYPV